jgi:hypothetical protein
MVCMNHQAGFVGGTKRRESAIAAQANRLDRAATTYESIRGVPAVLQVFLMCWRLVKLEKSGPGCADL